MERLKLSVKQIRKVEDIIGGTGAKYLEVLSPMETNQVIREGKPVAKIFREDGEIAGEISLKQAYLVRVFWA
jgi:hypothetical protein